MILLLLSNMKIFNEIYKGCLIKDRITSDLGIVIDHSKIRSVVRKLHGNDIFITVVKAYWPKKNATTTISSSIIEKIC